MMPLTSLLATLLLTAHGIVLVKRKTVSTAFCGGKPHVLATGEPVAHSCHVLPVDALEAEAEGQWLIAARIMAKTAAAGPLPRHAGIWRTRRR